MSSERASDAAPRTIALGSANPAKRRGVELALARAMPGRPALLVCLEVPSGVRDQPWGDDETRSGARNRAKAALQHATASGPSLADQAPIGVGVEGGLMRSGGVVWSFSWATAMTSDGRLGEARSAAFALPTQVAAMVGAGVELGDAMDRVYGVEDSKRAGGAVGLLTGGALERDALYEQMVLLALMQLLRGDGWAASVA